MRGLISFPTLADVDAAASLLVAAGFVAAFIYTLFGTSGVVA